MASAATKITLGGGCFWCIETSFRRLKGVVSSISGYTGGQTPNPTYESVIGNFIRMLSS
jgi:peptide-methionine (S)-S-oxide reductase